MCHRCALELGGAKHGEEAVQLCFVAMFLRTTRCQHPITLKEALAAFFIFLCDRLSVQPFSPSIERVNQKLYNI